MPPARYIAFIEASVTGAGIGALSACRELGVRTMLLSSNLEQYSRALRSAADLAVECDTGRSGEIVRTVHATTRSLVNIVGVTTTADLCVPQAAEVAVCLGLPTTSPESAWTARLKPLTRLALDSSGASHLNPRYAIVTCDVDALRAADEIGYPVLCKPPDLNDGRGVRLLHHAAAVKKYASDFQTRPKTCSGMFPIFRSDKLASEHQVPRPGSRECE